MAHYYRLDRPPLSARTGSIQTVYEACSDSIHTQLVANLTEAILACWTIHSTKKHQIVCDLLVVTGITSAALSGLLMIFLLVC